ncbi:MAG: SDR family oxidoreductase, partial [Mesorhizobium sp.]
TISMPTCRPAPTARSAAGGPADCSLRCLGSAASAQIDGDVARQRDVNNAFLFLASDDASYIIGTTIVVDGGQFPPEGQDPA